MDITSETKPPAKKWIKLNVGGILFQTSRETLLRVPNSMLARLVSDSELISDKDENDAILIDRDGKYFSPILNYLRHGKFILDANISAEGVLEEAEFYNLTPLISLVKEHIQRRDQLVLRSTDNKQRVYRVLQCQENELSSMVSHLGDGWRFEQLIAVGTQYQYGSSDDSAEFLFVVSKETTLSSPRELSDREEVLQSKGNRF